MARYAFDNDLPIGKCEDCPIVGVSHGFNMCMFQSELNPFGRILKPDEGVDSRPSWCPLQPLDDTECEGTS